MKILRGISVILNDLSLIVDLSQLLLLLLFSFYFTKLYRRTLFCSSSFHLSPCRFFKVFLLNRREKKSSESLLLAKLLGLFILLNYWMV